MRKLDISRTMLVKSFRSTRDAFRYRYLFGQVERFCMFIGYPRSGHSLTGSLLTAHPDIVISHERDVLKYLKRGFRERQLFALIMQRDGEFTEGGRMWYEFQYQVPGQWQGRVRRLRVIGDKKGGHSSSVLSTEPWLLDRLRSTLTVKLRIIHQVRNPFDNISTMNSRDPKPLIDTIDDYFTLCQSVGRIRKRLAPEELIDIRHEDLICDSKTTLTGLCRFLGVEADATYLDACASAVYESPHRSRYKIDWPKPLINEVSQRMQDFEFLLGYSFESES